MNKDETINKLADALWLMTKCFVAMSDGTPTGKVMDDTHAALNAAVLNGWQCSELKKAA